MDRASGIGKFDGFSLVKRENQAGINVGTLHNRLQEPISRALVFSFPILAHT